MFAKMKRKILLAVLLCAPVVALQAQDDVYFVPSEETEKAAEEPAFESTYSNVFATGTDNWAEGRGNNGWDVDRYNRRGAWADTAATDTTALYDGDEADDAGGSCTARLVRFHAPTVGVVVSSPYYYDYFDVLCWYDPWFYDTYFGWGWYGWGWRPYAWGAWWGGWYDPWWGPWGPGWAWGPGWGWWPPHHWHPAPPPGALRGPHGGFVHYAGRNQAVTRPSTRYGGRTGTGTAGLNRYRPSTRYGTGTSGRTWGNSRPAGQQNRPSRGGINQRPSSSYSPGRSFGSPSRGSVSRPSGRSSGGGFTGGARGGGRSFGGRR